ncbi:glutaredoxin-2, mitochondrial-like [Tachypleus tridentatus]|uniref:glutaredoxin-2, mitochondrial-like n=1 Tax=Tachypleus tridentatus TaxID=6853 RepID=UPI003FCF09D4
MDPEIDRYITSTVNENCVVLFSKSTCPHCVSAKKIFDKSKIPYKVVEIDKRGDEKELQNALELLTGARTVPRVFISGKCIGGATETKTLYKEGILLSLVYQCFRRYK